MQNLSFQFTMCLLAPLLLKSTSAIPGRYITITNPSNYLQLSQVAVYDKNDNNVALDSRASCTATPGHTFTDGRGESKCDWAIDGTLTARNDPEDYYLSSSATQGRWKLDLGRNVDIDRVVVYNRAGDDSHRLGTAEMTIIWIRTVQHLFFKWDIPQQSYQADLIHSLAQTHYMADSVANSEPIVVRPAAPTCNSFGTTKKLLCQGVIRIVCNNLNNDDDKKTCKGLTPHIVKSLSSVSSVKSLWNSLKTAGVALVRMYKGGNLSTANIFRLVDTFLRDTTGHGLSNAASSELQSLMNDMNSFLTDVESELQTAANQMNIAFDKANNFAELMLELFAEFYMGLGGGLARSYSGHRSREECYSCMDEFELLHEALNMNDQCLMMATSALGGAASAAFLAQGYGSCGMTMMSMTRCAQYKSFYCSQGISCEDFSDVMT